MQPKCMNPACMFVANVSTPEPVANVSTPEPVTETVTLSINSSDATTSKCIWCYLMLVLCWAISDLLTCNIKTAEICSYNYFIVVHLDPVTEANSTIAVTTTPGVTTERVTTTQPVVTTMSNILPSANSQVQAEQDCSGRRFDGASFIGGIVLCGGLLLIGAFIYKYYQSRVEARYHQF